MLHFGVFASRWPFGNDAICIIINRNEYSVVGPQIELPAVEGMYHFHLYHGVEPATERQGHKIVLDFAIDAKDYGGLFASKSPVPEALEVFLTKMKTPTGQVR